jgi:uncharacterized integral membrane protein
VKGLVLLGTAVIVAAAVAWLAIRNDERVTVDLLVTSLPDLALWQVLLGAFLCGGLAAAAALSWPYARLRLRVRNQARQITRLEQEVHGLRTLPLPDELPSAREG